MFKQIGIPELLIILFVVIILFGVGRLGRIGAELGKGIRNFRQAVSGEQAEGESEEPTPSGEQQSKA